MLCADNDDGVETTGEQKGCRSSIEIRRKRDDPDLCSNQYPLLFIVCWSTEGFRGGQVENVQGVCWGSDKLASLGTGDYQESGYYALSPLGRAGGCRSTGGRSMSLRSLGSSWEQDVSGSKLQSTGSNEK